MPGRAPAPSKIVLALCVTWGVSTAPGAETPARQRPPATWFAAWRQPPLADRPLQIVHGIDPRRAMPEGIGQDGMRYYRDRGLGGVVCNVAFSGYMGSSQNWKTLEAGIKQCEKLGMVVWLYDEQGYPSGAAGGLVLQQNRDFEATALTFDPSRDDPLRLRPAYEHTHAANNYYAARRYPNLIDDRAVRCFLAKTHDAYRQRFQKMLGGTIQATFTDEPSLMAVNIGQIPEAVRKTVTVVDPIDPSVRPLPCVPWCYDLPQRYRQRYNEDLLPRRRSLFVGNTTEDRRIRQQYWALIADLLAERYFGALQRWGAEHGVASSGHSLWEEMLIHHVPLEGNGLKMLAKMDIPGLDVLSSDPEAVIHTGWMTAAMPASAARLAGRRRVMTEVSDFSQKMGGSGPADLDAMRATAAWQAAWGVTDFTLYYGIGDRSLDDYRAYCNYVGRLNAILKPAQPAAEVLLYYPIYDLWAEYLPVAEKLVLESQSPRAQQIVRSFMRLGQMLQRNQIPFTLIDHEHLAAAKNLPDGGLQVGPQRYKAVLLPDGAQLPTSAVGVVDVFRESGGVVVEDRADAVKAALAKLRPPRQIDPASDRIVLGRFVRDSRPVLLLVNVGREPYEGHVVGDTAGDWLALDPVSGEIRPCERDPAGRLPLVLPPRRSVLLVRL